MYPKMVADSSSLILLTKAKIMEPLLKFVIIVIPKKVYDESVMISKEFGREDAYEIENYISKKKIEIMEASEKTMKEYEEMFNIEEGEKESLALTSELKVSMLCDDKRGMNAAKVLGIKIISSIAMVKVLYDKKRIDKKAALNGLDELEKYGWYKKDLIENMKEEIKKC